MTPELIFAIGDIHGRLDLLRAVLGAIEAHEPGRRRRLVFLGDYVDRGPEARGVIELLMSLHAGENVICLKGNHEQMMIKALVSGTTEAFEFWQTMGGRETLTSYGADDIESAEALVPAEHLRWMSQLPLTSGDGHRIYVHAGLLPDRPFEDQGEEICLWVRDRFLRAQPHQFDMHIVHGHTPTWDGKPEPAEPELLPHRTNLDLAAYATNSLGVGVFDAGRPGGPVAVLIVEQAPGCAVKVRLAQPSAAPLAGPARRRLGFGASRSRAAPLSFLQ